MRFLGVCFSHFPLLPKGLTWRVSKFNIKENFNCFGVGGACYRPVPRVKPLHTSIQRRPRSMCPLARMSISA